MQVKRFDQSEIWDIHNEYFLNRGLKAWSKGEVPYTGISNYYEAYKKVAFFYMALLKNPKIDCINILELGSGNGAFAINFLKAFEDIDQNNLFKKIKYTISDYSQKTLDELKDKLKDHEYFAKFSFKILDINHEFHQVADEDYDLIMSNYLLDQLPARIIAKDPNKNLYYEKYLSLENNPKKKIKKLKRKTVFQELDFANDIKLEHQKILDSCFRYKKKSTIVYSYGALRAIRRILYKLKPKGIYIASDFNASSKPGFDDFDPCFYGNSLAQAVNFEFICKYFFNEDIDDIEHKHFKQEAYQFVLIYEDPIKPLHTLILTRPDYPDTLHLNDIYNKVYNQNILLRFLYRYLVEFKYSLILFLLISVAFIFFQNFF